MKNIYDGWTYINDRMPKPKKHVVVLYYFNCAGRMTKALASGYFVNGSFKFHDKGGVDDRIIVSWVYMRHKGAR